MKLQGCRTAGQRDRGVGRILGISFCSFLLILFPMFLSQLSSDSGLRVALSSGGWRMTISEPQAGGQHSSSQEGGQRGRSADEG